MQNIRKTMKMAVTGTDCCGRKFISEVSFRLMPPKDQDYYGNGYYMTVEHDNCEHYIDVRYSGTTDITKLARLWIKDYYGPNAEDVREIA